MITCNRCGYAGPAEEKNCRKCGAPLASNKENGSSPKMGASEQPELPAWLESLRSSERPVASSGGSAEQFNAANLIDEGALPAWMRSDRLGGGQPIQGQGPSQPQGSASGTRGMSSNLRPSSTPAPNTDENAFGGHSISAGSLVDEQALPAWLRQQGGSGTAGSNIPASSLIEPDAMPDWMKSMPPSQAAQAVPPPQRPMQTMSQQQPPQTPPMGLASAAQSSPPSALERGFSAHDLIDQQALPAWMRQGDQPDATRPATTSSQMGSPIAPGQVGFSASSLLDMNALPAWMRESEQSARGSVAQPTSSTWQGAQSQQSSAPTQGRMGQSGPTWQQQQPPQQIAPTASPSGTFSAASFIDVNALPEWLRSSAEQGQQAASGSMSSQQRQGGSAGVPRQGPYVVPPRVENVRVPSRPRSEMGPHEGSEAAANVFASMLGVASAAPQFPVGQGQMQQGQMQQGQMQQGQMQQGQMQQGQIPQGRMPGQAGPSYGGTMAGPASPQMMPPSGMQGMGGMQQQQQPPQGYMQGGYPGAGQMGMSSMSPQAAPQGSMPPASYTSMGVASMSGNATMMNGQETNAKPAKRGIFEAIRSWLTRQ